MTSPLARGACPRLSAPMQTGDGLLARIVTVGPIPLDKFALLCAAAREHGNGVIEIGARGSVQVRGLTSQSAPLFAEVVTSLGVDVCDGMPVIVSPLCDDPAALIDADGLAADLRGAIAERDLALAPKVSVAVDGGGLLHLDALAVDIRLRAVRTASGPMLHVALAGDASSATPLGLAALGNAPEVVTELLSAIAALGPEARAAELLRAKGIGAVRASLRARLAPAPQLPPRKAAEFIGRHWLKDGACALGLGLAFGHSHADALITLAGVAEKNGADWARPAPDRALLLGPFTEIHAATVSKAANQLGFITDASDSRRRIVACSGAPFCTSGLISSRAIAAGLSSELPAALPLVHVSGCAKGCAHPGPASLTIVGTNQGCDIVRDGTARDVPEAHVTADTLPAALGRLTQACETAHA
jgi:precorrin-3B synthase